MARIFHHRFSPMLYGLLAIAAAFLFPTLLPAAPPDTPDTYRIYRMHDHDDIFVPSPVLALAPEADRLMEPSPVRHRKPAPLAPEYMTALKTDALNFVETRLRC